MAILYLSRNPDLAEILLINRELKKYNFRIFLIEQKEYLLGTNRSTNRNKEIIKRK